MNATLPGSSLKDFARVLTCFSKIGDEVSLEAKPGQLYLSAINSSKSAFMLVVLDATRFERFEYIPLPNTRGDAEIMRCKFQLRALLSIFRPRNIDSKDGKESTIEKCELKLLHPTPESTDCDLLVRLICKHGIRKTYKLQYETTQAMRAMTDKSTSLNRLTIPAQAFKEVMDHFAPRAEELSLAVHEGQLKLTSFTEGIVTEKEILKQPVHTSITIDNQEFLSMEVDEEALITFFLREFKAVITLCDALSTDVTLIYADAERPLIVEFEKDGMQGELVVATIADGDRSRATPPAAPTKRVPKQHQPRIVNNEALSQARSNFEDRSGMPDWHDHSIPPPSNMRQPSLYEETRGVPEYDDSPLFVPDPDAERMQDRPQEDPTDPSVYRLTNAFAHEDSRSDLRKPENDNDEMELFEDDRFFEEDGEPLGPTQLPHERPKSIFD